MDGALGLNDDEDDDDEEVRQEAKEKKKRIRQQTEDEAAFDPEEAYLRINANLRTAFKKQHQLPLVS